MEENSDQMENIDYGFFFSNYLFPLTIFDKLFNGKKFNHILQIIQFIVSN